MYIKKNDTLGSIVARNLQAASIFNSYGLNFYSLGDRMLPNACLEDNATISAVLEDLWELKDPGTKAADFTKMSLNDLSVYILKNHHEFAERKVVFINNALDRMIRETSEGNQSLRKIKKTFSDFSLYLTIHLKHEEFVIFPFIQKMTKTKTVKFTGISPLEDPIISMREDHNHEVSVLKRLEEMTGGYTAPRKADYGLRITYEAMKELHDDLKIHMHLENNILFPKALHDMSTNHQPSHA